MNFTELNIPEYIVKALEKQNITKPTEIQELTIPALMEGKDLVGASETGSGKTYAFGIPAINIVNPEENFIQVLVICPTRELACQVCDEMRKLTEFKEGCKMVPVYGGSNMERQIQALKRAKIVVGTPGRIMDHINRRTLRLKALKMLVLDEADEMLNMGFKDDIEKIIKETNPHRQTVMFSATMPKPILAITENYMHNPVNVSSKQQAKAQTFIKQFYTYVGRDKKAEALIKMVKTFKPKTAIIFCNTKKMVDSLVKNLNLEGIDAVGIQGDMRQNERKRTIDGIKRNNKGILVATDVVARGIDINNVDIIFNYDLPVQTESYIHRIGRTARAGKAGLAYTIINTKAQKEALSELERVTKNEIVEYDCGLKGLAPKSSYDNKDKNSYSKNHAKRDFNRTGNSANGYKNSREKNNKGGLSNKKSFSSSGKTFNKNSKETKRINYSK